MICHVFFNERKNLLWKWLMQTHEDTQKKIQRQQIKKTFINDFAYVYSKKNFAWKHYRANIHVMMIINILHQLHKKIIMNLILWIVILLIDFYLKKKDENEQTNARSKKHLKKHFLIIDFDTLSANKMKIL